MPDRASYNRFAVIEGGAFQLGSPADATLSGGGGDGTSGDMEARVSKLEAEMRTISEALIRIETKLDAKASAVEVAEIKTKLDAKASAENLSSLAGKVSQLPTTLQLLGFVIAVFVASGLVKHFFP